ncbi:MAG: hypothetical protein ACPGJI_04405 [Kangiellaceae bacterium]
MKLLKNFSMLAVFIISGCAHQKQSNSNDYRWELDLAKIQKMEEKAKRGPSPVQLVWVNPPRIKVKNSN